MAWGQGGWKPVALPDVCLVASCRELGVEIAGALRMPFERLHGGPAWRTNPPTNHNHRHAQRWAHAARGAKPRASGGADGIGLDWIGLDCTAGPTRWNSKRAQQGTAGTKEYAPGILRVSTAVRRRRRRRPSCLSAGSTQRAHNRCVQANSVSKHQPAGGNTARGGNGTPPPEGAGCPGFLLRPCFWGSPGGRPDDAHAHTSTGTDRTGRGRGTGTRASGAGRWWPQRLQQSGYW